MTQLKSINLYSSLVGIEELSNYKTVYAQTLTKSSGKIKLI